MQDQLRTFRVPKTDVQRLPKLAAQYRELRLKGLELSPSSFSSTYEIESRYPLEYWESAISTLGKELFICATPDDIWVAQLVIRGPISETDFRLPAEAEQPELPAEEAEKTSNWQFLGLYVNPIYRSQGISQRLVACAIEWLERSLSYAQSVNQFRFRAMIKPDNVPSQRLFQKLGFDRAGTCTLREAHIANGEVDANDKSEKVSEGALLRGGHVYILLRQVKEATE